MFTQIRPTAVRSRAFRLWMTLLVVVGFVTLVTWAARTAVKYGPMLLAQ